MDYRSELNRLVAAASEASGQPETDIMSRSRRWPLPQCRWLIAERLMRQGCSEKGAARLIGMNHSTIAYGIRCINEVWLWGGYEQEREIKDRFYKILDNGNV